jgi:hypothetical protein
MKYMLDKKKKYLAIIMVIYAFCYEASAQGISDSYSRSIIKGDKAVAGLVGSIQNNSRVQNTYSSGFVISSSVNSTGGLIGVSQGNYSVSQSYWDLDHSNIIVSAAGEGRSTNDMTYPYGGNTYTSWDFVNTWVRDINNNNRGYPYQSFRTPVLYELSLNKSLEEAGQLSGAEMYSYGATVFISATAQPGYTFREWKDDSGEVLSDQSDYEFYMPERDYSLIAEFDPAEFLVSVAVWPANGGTVTGVGAYNFGDEVTLKAVPAEGFEFLNWTDELDNVLSESETYSFTLGAADVQLNANFEIMSSTDDVSSMPFRVMPNPINEQCILSNAGSVKRLSILDSQGKVLVSLQSYNGESIDMSAYPEGIYLLSLIDLEGQSWTQKIIKSN